MPIVNESTAVEMRIALRGDDDSLQIPTTLKWRLDNETGDQVVTGWASLTPESITTISIPATSNAMQDSTAPYEDRVVTIMSDEGLATQQVYIRKYRIENLGGIT